MSQFEEPTVLATFDRSWKPRDGEGKSKSERLQLERGSFNGYSTFTLRVVWQADDGSWRWASAKPSQSGKCFQSMNLKARELRALGEALIAAAADAGGQPRAQRQRVRDTPQRQSERARFDAQGSIPESTDDGIPF